MIYTFASDTDTSCNHDPYSIGWIINFLWGAHTFSSSMTTMITYRIEKVSVMSHALERGKVSLWLHNIYPVSDSAWKASRIFILRKAPLERYDKNAIGDFYLLEVNKIG